jgi:phosphoglycerate dehydrogenase-like enzyme
MKAVLDMRISDAVFRRLSAAAAPLFDCVMVDEADEPGRAAAFAEAEILLHVLKPVTGAAIAGAPRLRLIQKIGVGVNTIDLEAAEARGIAVCNMPGTNTQAVVEATLLLILAALRRLAGFDRQTRQGRGWSRAPDAFDWVGELAGRTVGLVGYGAVGARLAATLGALGARVLYTARGPKPDAVGAWRELDALLAEADVVSLHLPLTAETQRLIDARRLRLMKPGSVLVNTARGGLVDEAALIDALRSGHLAAAGLDVFAEEPVPPANPLLAMEQVVVMPHIAWQTPETWERSLDLAIENCRRLASGEDLLNRVV